MEALDARALITCNLGEVIQGGISDSYLQNSGLVFTKGSITLVGAVTPEIGTECELQYEGPDGVGTPLPRQLYVISAFADPLAEITEVSLGCLLTYLDGIVPVPSLTNEANYITPAQLYCANGLATSLYPPPLRAEQLLQYCAQKLGITVNPTLTNDYAIDKYDLSPGYVATIGKLLLSESKCGYVTAGKELIVIDLDTIPTGGNTIDSSKIISIAGVNSGELPASIVLVPYIDKKLKDYDPNIAQWDENTVIGNPQSVQLAWNAGTQSVTHTPVSRTVSRYGEPVELTTGCQLPNRGYGDLSNTVVARTSSNSTCLGHSSGGYATALFENGFDPGVTRQGDVEQEINTLFDDKDRPYLVSTATYEPMFVYAGRMSLPWVVDGDALILGNEKVLVELTTEEREYADVVDNAATLKPGEEVPEGFVFERVKRQTYQAFGKTQGGSQAPAESTTIGAFKSIQAVSQFIDNSLGLVLTNSEVVSNKVFNPKGDTRPSDSDRAAKYGTVDNVGRVTKYAEVQFADYGDNIRVTQYAPPHLAESYFEGSGAKVIVDTKGISMRFGRSQHRIAVGNRLGANLQITAADAPTTPFEPIYLSLKDYQGQYAANGLNYAFDSNGLVCSVDAIYIGANGRNGSTKRLASKADTANPWFYLPTNYDITKLPLASEGQLIPPFNEVVNTAGAIAIGVKVDGQRSEVLPVQTVSVGVKVGVDGTNGTTIEIIHAGVSIGANAISKIGSANECSVGVKVGAAVESGINTNNIIEVGVKIGQMIGPAEDEALLLVKFDDIVDPWIDSSPNALNLSPLKAPPAVFEPMPDFLSPRFGPGCALLQPSNPDDPFDSSWQGGLLHTGTGFDLGDDAWTVEFWLYILPTQNQTDQFCTFLSVIGSSALNQFGWSGYRFGTRGLGTATEKGPGVVLQLSTYYEKSGFGKYQDIYDGTAPVISEDEWVHIAFVRKMGEPGTAYPNDVDQVFLYQNGIRVCTGIPSYGAKDSGSAFKGEYLSIGCAVDGTGAYDFQQPGWALIDEIRIVKGKAIYTEPSFTPPTGAF